jgi:opacity protein-like surface antigen
MAVSDDLLAGNVINVGDATLRNAGGACMASCQYAWHNGRGSWKAVQGRHGTDGASKRVSKSVGWTVGGGIDYAVTNNWSIFAEYRYTNFGTISAHGLAAVGFATFPGLTSAALNSNRTINQNQVQVGFSYRFDMGGPVPVVAKY